MKDKLFEEKIIYHERMETLKTKIARLQLDLDTFKAQDKCLDQDIELELRKNLTNHYELGNYKFDLETEVTTTILKSKRQDAIKYNNKFKVGIFALTIQGMKLKAWVKEILSQNMPVPDFISYEQYPKIRIEKIL
jgi:hypothetical protein